MHGTVAGMTRWITPHRKENMRRVYWSLIVGIIAVVVGIFLGVTGLLLLPIVGVFVLIGILFWLAERKAEHKPPVE